jgi:hypothetical protein
MFSLLIIFVSPILCLSFCIQLFDYSMFHPFFVSHLTFLVIFYFCVGHLTFVSHLIFLFNHF